MVSLLCNKYNADPFQYGIVTAGKSINTASYVLYQRYRDNPYIYGILQTIHDQLRDKERADFKECRQAWERRRPAPSHATLAPRADLTGFPKWRAWRTPP